MDLKTIKKNIDARGLEHIEFINKAEVAERYYHADNDIKYKRLPEEDETNPRKSIHRIPSRFYSMIVDQKATYMFGKTPFFDLGRDTWNEQVKEALGKHFGTTCKKLVVDAANCGVSWLHFWVTGQDDGTAEDKDKGDFKYHYVDPKQIIPIWGGNLEQELLAVMRHYPYTDLDGKHWEVYEWWDKEFCYAYRKKKELTTNRSLKPFNKFFYYSTNTSSWEATNVYKHGFDRVPFIAFKNNVDMTSDLLGLKERIDAYDEVNSQFASDLEDFQEMIFVLSGYGKEPPEDFLQRLKQHKLIKLESGYPDKIQPNLETLAVEIPIDARKLGMEMNRKAIFEQGGGVDQTPDVLNYTSGEALKYRYALLELKATMTEDEFRKGFAILIFELAKHLGIDITIDKIEQRWTRTKVNNDTELMNNARLCLGFTSLRTALKVNPYVEDVDEEIKQLDAEYEKDLKRREEEFNRITPTMNTVRPTANDTQAKVQSSNERVLNNKQSENKSKSPEKYQVGKAVSGSGKN